MVNLGAIPHEFVNPEQITVDYLNCDNRLQKFFPVHFTEPKFRKYEGNRRKIVEKLVEYNEKINSPRQVIQNIESLSKPKTYAVVTGQQPGLFCGPLYTIYKAISAIVLSERLSGREHSLVPIFWNASEDHDISEVDCITLFKHNEPVKICGNIEPRDVAFSHIRIDRSQLKKMLTKIRNLSPNSEFKRPILKEIQDVIDRSSTIGDFFSKMITFLLGDRGLIIVEPRCLRELMVPIFRKLIRNPTECTRILGESNSKLKKLGYSPRIHKNHKVCNFFVLSEKGKRMQVTFDKTFKIGEKSFSQRQLLRLLDEDPFRFSANAITRPITQDYLFPTFAYVAGPNEIAYYAQLKQVYGFFSLEMPVIFPRFGATVVESKVAKVLKKYDEEIGEFSDPEELLKKLAKEEISDVFDSFEKDVLKGSEGITQEAEDIDKNLIGSCKLAEGKILKTIKYLEDKIASSTKRQNSIARRQIMKVHNNIFPDGNLQERRINVLEYLIKFGGKFLNIVYDNFSRSEYGEHKVIRC